VDGKTAVAMAANDGHVVPQPAMVEATAFMSPMEAQTIHMGKIITAIIQARAIGVTMRIEHSVCQLAHM
jgi:hypothetical protein